MTQYMERLHLDTVSIKAVSAVVMGCSPTVCNNRASLQDSMIHNKMHSKTGGHTHVPKRITMDT